MINILWFCFVFVFSSVIMALEQITGLNFREKRMLLDVDEDSGTDLRAALYNSTHFEIPHTFDVGIAVYAGRG